MLASELLDLFGLLGDDCGNIFDLRINDFLVGLVNQRCDEEDRGCQEGKAPDGNDLDEIIGDECTDEGLKTLSALLTVEIWGTYGNRSENVLGKQDSLSLDDKEVDEFMDIAN